MKMESGIIRIGNYSFTGKELWYHFTDYKDYTDYVKQYTDNEAIIYTLGNLIFSGMNKYSKYGYIIMNDFHSYISKQKDWFKKNQ